MPAKKAKKAKKKKPPKVVKKAAVRSKKVKKAPVTKKELKKMTGKSATKAVKGKKKAAARKKAPSAKKKPLRAEVALPAGKLIYYFGDGRADGSGQMKDLLGGKGAGLAEMTNTRVPVPPGFTITTEACTLFYQNNMQLPREFEEEMNRNISRLEKSTGMGFGDKKKPLLVSVRSGAKFSMPGMMDTILNLGLNDETLEGLIRKTENDRFCFDSYRRFIQMFGNVVLGIDKSEFEELLEVRKKKQRVKFDTELTVNDLKYIIKKFKELIT